MQPMKQSAYLILLLSCCMAQASYAQHHINISLKKELDSMLADDQRYRELMVIQPGKERDSIAQALHIPPDDVTGHFGALQNQLDSANLRKVVQVFDQYGYPGIALVDTPTNEVAYYVIQHSNQIARYFPVIKKAGKEKQLSYTLVAM